MVTRSAMFLLGCCALAAGCRGKPEPSSLAPDDRKATAAAKDGAVPAPVLGEQALAQLAAQLGQSFGAAHAERLRTGLRQVGRLWRDEDGNAEELAAFAKQHFAAEPQVLADTFNRLQYALEMIEGHGHEVQRELTRFSALDEGPERPIDALLAAYNPTAHAIEDLFRTKLAFVALLNFPLTTLDERLAAGSSWSRERWAQARLTAQLEHRVPAAVRQQITRASSDAERYIDAYNIHMDRLASSAPGRSEAASPFPAGLKLISHWGLRDEIRGQYGREGALERQQLIARVMERIVKQEIPRQVINARELQWDPATNLVRARGGEWQSGEREPDARYEQLLRVFRALRAADPFYPTLPTHIQRVFLRDRELPEQRVRELFESVLTSRTAQRVAALMQQRLGRKLEPFDIWYAGFRPRASIDERQLDELTRKRFPTAKSFQQALPGVLQQLGFDAATAAWLGERIVVEPSRGPGHADGAMRRDDKAHLRTRVGRDGMDYKGFNIAIHELGHNVEQVFSISRIDHTLLAGVPNTGFTEAFAFLFQARDLELLGQKSDAPQAEALRTVDRFWSAFEIAGVAMLDIEIWHWMYEHPQATPAELRAAVVQLAAQVWNRYFAPVLGRRDSLLLAIYSHIIAFGLYTPDYPLGLLITFQIEQHMQDKPLGAEMERMCRLGRLAPDVWMKQAVGQPLTSSPLLSATDKALAQLALEQPASAPGARPAARKTAARKPAAKSSAVRPPAAKKPAPRRPPGKKPVTAKPRSKPPAE